MWELNLQRRKRSSSGLHKRGDVWTGSWERGKVVQWMEKGIFGRELSISGNDMASLGDNTRWVYLEEAKGGKS